MSNSVDSPTPGEINGDSNTTPVEPNANPEPVSVPPTAVDANGDDQPDLTEAEKAETDGDGA